jgi:hypothetical protein
LPDVRELTNFTPGWPALAGRKGNEMAYACWKCGKEIKGERIAYTPSLLAIRLGADFNKSYHPKCYEKEEEESEKELSKETIHQNNTLALFGG